MTATRVIPNRTACVVRWLPHLIWAAGLLVLFWGLLIGPGIPYQDPTPELSLLYAEQTRAAERVVSAGAVLFCSGVLLAATTWMVRRWRRRTPHPRRD